MKIITQKTEKLSGTVIVPGSKSQTIRGLVFGFFAKGTSAIINHLNSDDTKVALKVCKLLGAKIQAHKTSIAIKSPGLPINSRVEKIFTGDSGITTRFILPVLGLRKNCHQPVILDCGKQMKSRPIKPLLDALNKLGMKIVSIKGNNHCPLKISGKLIGGKAQISGITSQYLSALLISLPCAEKDSEITVIDLRERPYVEMTEGFLKEFGIKYSHTRTGNKDIYRIKGGQKYKSFSKQISGDFSSASYLLAAGALFAGNIKLLNLDIMDSQGDKALLNTLKKMGASIQVKPSKIIINGGKLLRGVKIDAGAIPDLVPTLAVLGTQARGKTEITNVPQARLKETDRLKSMAEGLGKMGAKIYEKPDGLVIHQSALKGNQVRGFNDHRTVMALTLAGMLAEGKTVISHAEAVKKTYPKFYRDLKKLGAKIKIIK